VKPTKVTGVSQGVKLCVKSQFKENHAKGIKSKRGMVYGIIRYILLPKITAFAVNALTVIIAIPLMKWSMFMRAGTVRIVAMSAVLMVTYNT